MYNPSHFVETSKSEIEGLLEAFPLATLVVQTVDGLVANHIPILMDKQGGLFGHIALANDLHRCVENGADVLVIFQGDQTYISPNWYPSKAEHHRHVPTWNYEVVHIRGRIRFAHDSKSKRAVVGRLTKHFEERTNGDKAWKMSQAPADFLDDMLAAIVAFEIDVDQITGKSKLSQNRTDSDNNAVSSTLKARGETRLGDRMDRIDRD